MTTHTPGPWTIAEGKTFCAIRTNGRVIADMRYVGQHYNKADARLIAAAPDLLEALEAYVSADDEIYGDSIGGEVREKARAAIDKATQEPTA